MRPVVSVQATGSPPSAVHQLSTGAQLRFGACRCGDCPYELRLPGTTPSVAGHVTADRDHWRLTNHGQVDLLVFDLERSHDMITVPTGRLAVVVPFELARIIGEGRPLLTVFGPEPGPPAPAPTDCPALPDHRPPTLLNPDATYFAVLVTLCEPRLRPVHGLRSAAPPPLPTSAEIAHRLRQRGFAVSARAVDSHIDYLIDKLRLRDPGTTGAARRTWRKETLVTTAIRRGLVAHEHLSPHSPHRR